MVLPRDHRQILMSFRIVSYDKLLPDSRQHRLRWVTCGDWGVLRGVTLCGAGHSCGIGFTTGGNAAARASGEQNQNCQC
jgi:hypothetical protein